jgi:hypothetical protein
MFIVVMEKNVCKTQICLLHRVRISGSPQYFPKRHWQRDVDDHADFLSHGNNYVHLLYYFHLLHNLILKR